MFYCHVDRFYLNAAFSWGVSFFGVIVVNKLTCGKESRTVQRVALLLVGHGIKCGTPLGAFGQSWAELIYKALRYSRFLRPNAGIEILVGSMKRQGWPMPFKSARMRPRHHLCNSDYMHSSQVVIRSASGFHSAGFSVLFGFNHSYRSHKPHVELGALH